MLMFSPTSLSLPPSYDRSEFIFKLSSTKTNLIALLAISQRLCLENL
jgi:hypothetical protein